MPAEGENITEQHVGDKLQKEIREKKRGTAWKKEGDFDYDPYRPRKGPVRDAILEDLRRGRPQTQKDKK